MKFSLCTIDEECQAKGKGTKGNEDEAESSQ